MLEKVRGLGIEFLSVGRGGWGQHIAHSAAAEASFFIQSAGCGLMGAGECRVRLERSLAVELLGFSRDTHENNLKWR